MSFKLAPLPFEESALEPFMSAATLRFHHCRHHRTYVEKLNGLIAGTTLAGKALEDIICSTAGDERKSQQKIFNNAAQVWNHDFFWHSMRPKGGGEPTGSIGRAIAQRFGDLDKFKAAFKKAAKDQFGSGYVWLVVEDGALKLRNAPNAMTPMVDGQTAVLGCDVWEHAYYLDYQDRRAEFVEAFLEHLANWDFAAEQLENAPARPKKAARRG